MAPSAAAQPCKALQASGTPDATAPLPQWETMRERTAEHLHLTRTHGHWTDPDGVPVHLKTATRAHERPEHTGRSPMELQPLHRGTTCGTWWILLPHINAETPSSPTPRLLHQLGQLLRHWHELTPARGTRLDSPSGTSIYLGTALRHDPNAYPHLARELSQACISLPMVPIHGDLAHDHNLLRSPDGTLTIIDPGAIAIGPAALDLAFAHSRAQAQGASRTALESLLEGYHEPVPGLARVLPVIAARTAIDRAALGAEHNNGRHIDPARQEPDSSAQ